jgi:hypothetical protein
MALRIEFTAPLSLVFKGLEVDRIDHLDLETGTVSGYYSLLRADGKRWRSQPFSFVMPAALKNFVTAVLNRLTMFTDKLDGVDAPLTGTVKEVPDGTPIP